jgi:predicted DNA-binding transcriptional regulator YafY
VAEYYEVEEQGVADGKLEIVLPTKDISWVAKLILRLGGEAEVVEPPELRELAISVLEATRSRYA